MENFGQEKANPKVMGDDSKNEKAPPVAVASSSKEEEKSEEGIATYGVVDEKKAYRRENRNRVSVVDEVHRLRSCSCLS